MTTSIPIGPATEILQNVVYALPPRAVFLTALTEVETSIDGSNWIAQPDSVTGVIVGSIFVRCTTDDTIIVCSDAVRLTIATDSLFQVDGLGIQTEPASGAISFLNSGIIIADALGTARQWQFLADGNLQLPGYATIGVTENGFGLILNAYVIIDGSGSISSVGGSGISVLDSLIVYKQFAVTSPDFPSGTFYNIPGNTHPTVKIQGAVGQTSNLLELYGTDGVSLVGSIDVNGVASFAGFEGGVLLQITTPGVEQTGNINISGTILGGSINVIGSIYGQSGTLQALSIGSPDAPVGPQLEIRKKYGFTDFPFFIVNDIDATEFAITSKGGIIARDSSLFQGIVDIAASYARAYIGSGGNAIQIVVSSIVGTAGNSYTVQVVIAGSPNAAMGAALVATALTITLGTDAGGLPDDTKNTLVLITAAIDGLGGTPFDAFYYGSGSLDTAEGPTTFTGGYPGYIKAQEYIVGSHAGIDASVTTASLVGKTITIEKGIITGFA